MSNFNIYNLFCSNRILLKAFFAVTIGLMLLNCSTSYVDKVERSGGYEFRPGFPEVRVVTAGIIDEYTDSTSISITAEIVYASLVFKKEDDAYSTQILVEIQILDQLDPLNIIQTISYPITIVESDAQLISSQEEYLINRKVPIVPGDYLINFSITDTNTDKATVRTSEVFIPNPNDRVSHITNIQVFSKDERYENNFNPITTYDISNEADSIRFSFQVTNNKPEAPLTINTRLLKFRSDTTIARPMNWPNYTVSHVAYRGIHYSDFEVINSSRRIITQDGSVTIEFVFPNLPRGNYRFEIKSDTEGVEELFRARDFSVKSLNYPSLKTPKELAAPLFYLMNPKDYEKLMSIADDVQLKREIDRFWLKNIKNSKKAQNVIELYYERVEEANKQFANYKEGWKTDMGMIYILFGPPWYINSSLDRLSWSYSYNFNDIEENFYFRAPVMKNKEYPFYNYQLVRSPQYHQVQYQQIQFWLTGVILKDNL